MNIPDTTPTPSPFLQSFISRTLRVTTTDTRVFLGELKCTDKDKNLILSSTHEYRYPSARDVSAAATAAAAAEKAAGEGGEEKEGGEGRGRGRRGRRGGKGEAGSEEQVYWACGGAGGACG
ncbi:uncharacterized protein LAJ45_09862 [Morchella importuna]|uniref:uncharacterized protein n=1 Tax=Morchella importuna TaxID=1174673 RepID=UPI001E8DC375|nr:uncharacterized protein LAJ45_09862 [Morchella importuna]KAH8146172.1 hypothetical protein LAJ45_09862 [Morchella importuna]